MQANSSNVMNKKKLLEIKNMVKITIDHDKCEGADCAECIDVCPMEVLILDGEKVVIQNKEECSLCEVCMDVCPNEAVVVEDDD